MQRGQILIRILELLHEQAMTQVDFFSAVLTSGYGASASQIEYEYQKRRGLTSRREAQMEDLRNKKLRLQKFLSKLKHDSLIKETEGANAGFIISISLASPFFEIINPALAPSVSLIKLSCFNLDKNFCKRSFLFLKSSICASRREVSPRRF